MLVYQKVNHLPMQGMQLQALEGVLYPSGPRSEVSHSSKLALETAQSTADLATATNSSANESQQKTQKKYRSRKNGTAKTYQNIN